MTQQERWDNLLFPGTNTLRNKQGITDEQAWQQAEGQLSLRRSLTLPALGFDGTLSNQLAQTHEHLFQDCYDWAGQFRDLDMTIPSASHPDGYATFASHTTIEARIAELDEVVDALDSANYDDKIEALAYLHCELNEIHAFREGNGRTTRALMETLATRYDIELSWEGHISQLHDVSAASMAGTTLNSAPFHNFYKQVCQPASHDDADLTIDELFAQQHEIDATKNRLDQHFDRYTHAHDYERKTPTMAQQNWDVPLDFYGRHFDLKVTVDRYVNGGRPGITLTHEEDGNEEIFTTLTENAPHIDLDDDRRQIIVNHDVTRETLNAVFDSGLLNREPDDTVYLGMAACNVHSFTDEAQTWINDQLQNIEIDQSQVDAFAFAQSAYPNGIQLNDSQTEQGNSQPQSETQEYISADSDATEA